MVLISGGWYSFSPGYSTIQRTLNSGPALIQRHLPYVRESENDLPDDVSRYYCNLWYPRCDPALVTLYLDGPSVLQISPELSTGRRKPSGGTSSCRLHSLILSAGRALTRAAAGSAG